MSERLMDQDLLADWVAFAAGAHWDQEDQNGDPYILHPLRVMHRVKVPATVLGVDLNLARIVAVMHDVVEDTPVTLDALKRRHMPEEALVAMDHITHRKGEPYAEYLDRAMHNRISFAVKMADVADNGNEARLARIEDPARQRHLRRKYAHAASVLLDQLQTVAPDAEIA